MVKLEPLDGMSEFVEPSSVVRIAGIPESWESRNIKAIGSFVYMRDGNSIKIKGTPEEVHAKLFPEAEGELGEDRREAMWRVLRWVYVDAQFVPEHVKNYARKALGREGA